MFCTYEKYLNLSKFLNVLRVVVSCLVRDAVADIVVLNDSAKIEEHDIN